MKRVRRQSMLSTALQLLACDKKEQKIRQIDLNDEIFNYPKRNVCISQEASQRPEIRKGEAKELEPHKIC